MSFDSARQIANAVLYEGYLLYPYRASALKNRYRWQFGVVAPCGFAENGGCEPWEMQTECLIEPGAAPTVDVMIRFLQVWDQADGSAEHGIEQERIYPDIDVRGLRSVEEVETLEVDHTIAAVVRFAAREVGPYLMLRVRIENLTPWDAERGNNRGAALRHSLVSAHTLLQVRDGAFISLMNPPPQAKEAAASCANRHTWPVMAGRPGERDVLLSSPIILYDYPTVAPESPGELCDSTEIDELLSLRILTLTEEEKREARATDHRARAILERTENFPAEIFERLHGAIRQMSPAEMHSVEEFFNPSNETAPEETSVRVGSVTISAGDRVRIQPRRRSDSMDQFLAGRLARVKAVHHDVDGRTYVGVALDGDAASDMDSEYRRYFYYDPDELEPQKEG